MARPSDEKPGVLRPSQSGDPRPDAGGAPRTLAMWSEHPRPVPRPSTQWPPHQPPMPATLVLPQNPLSNPYGGRVIDALARRPRWGLRISLAVAGLALGMIGALPFLPHVPRPLRPVRDGIAALTGLGLANARADLDGEDVGQADDPAVAPHGPKIVPLPPAEQLPPVVAARPDPRPLRHAPPALATTREVNRPVPGRARGSYARQRAGGLAITGPGQRHPASVPAAGDPFDEGARAAAPAQAPEVASAPAPAPGERTPPSPEAAPAPAEPAPASRPARVAEPAAPRPVPGSLDDLMATAVQNPPPKGKSELDRKLAGIDESRDVREAARRKQEAAAPDAHSLTRSEIQTAMKAIQAKVRDCAHQFQSSGNAELKVTVSEDGSVKAVNVMGVFAGTPTASCLERAVKGAVFPASTGLRFDYPLALR
jgi:hypothetical protein